MDLASALARVPTAFWGLPLVVVAGFGSPWIAMFVSVPLGGLLAGMLARESQPLFKLILGAAVLACLVLIATEAPSYRGDMAATVGYLLLAAGGFASLGWHVSARGRSAGEQVAALVVGVVAGFVNVGLFFALFLELQ